MKSEGTNQPPFSRGRCIGLRSQGDHFIFEIQSSEGTQEVSVPQHQINTKESYLGDWIQIQKDHVLVLSRNSKPNRDFSFQKQALHPRRRKNVEIRNKVETCIRDYFNSQGFEQIRTPLLVPNPGMEVHIRPFQVAPYGGLSETPFFLPTSPEFAMKRLLSGGLEKIYQLAPSFRVEPPSHTHSPEFTMLEWYEAFADEHKLMQDVEALFLHTALALHKEPRIYYQGRTLDLTPPWPRRTVRSLFEEFVGCELEPTLNHTTLEKACRTHKIGISNEDTSEDLFFKLWLNEIEPKFPQDRLFFVTEYPSDLAALARVDPETGWARRFEVYGAGLELGNAFYELTDPAEQKKRFIEDMDKRAHIYGNAFPKTPLDLGFQEALEEGLPPCAGIAMGVDRMIMLFANECEINWTFQLPIS